MSGSEGWVSRPSKESGGARRWKAAVLALQWRVGPDGSAGSSGGPPGPGSRCSQFGIGAGPR